MIGLFSSLVRPMVQATTAGMWAAQNTSGVFVRTLMKSHKGAAKRWRKTANAFKRRPAARNHGNAGWSRKTLHSNGFKRMSNPAQTRRLRKLLPYH